MEILYSYLWYQGQLLSQGQADFWFLPYFPPLFSLKSAISEVLIMPVAPTCTCTWTAHLITPSFKSDIAETSKAFGYMHS